jgi:hypothetical protein
MPAVGNPPPVAANGIPAHPDSEAAGAKDTRDCAGAR